MDIRIAVFVGQAENDIMRMDVVGAARSRTNCAEVAERMACWNVNLNDSKDMH